MTTMHKLDRDSVVRPACLDVYTPPQTWDAVSTQDKEAIRIPLKAMQGDRCAYCEAALYDDRHIEHFRRKNPEHYPELAFIWDNLFLSCNSQDHCGHYKDRSSAPPYNADDLVKPDIENPDEFLHFGSDGVVSPNSQETTEKQRRGGETIRVFGLNDSRLCHERRRIAARYLNYENGIIDALLTMDSESRESFIRDEILATRDWPHCTVVRHLFRKVH